MACHLDGRPATPQGCYLTDLGVACPSVRAWLERRSFVEEIMKARLMNRVAWAFLILVLVAPIWAHHGNAAFDSDKRVTMKGTVTEWFWANPHCFLQFDAK